MIYVFICIGTTKIVGDSLGPIAGSYLKTKYQNKELVKVYGDINNPIDFYNIGNTLKSIEERYNNKCTKIIIDSALGNDIGSFIINKGEIYLGQGLNKYKRINGDINIIGIVGKNYKNPIKNFIELKNLKKSSIEKMAYEMVKAIDICRL